MAQLVVGCNSVSAIDNREEFAIYQRMFFKPLFLALFKYLTQPRIADTSYTRECCIMTVSTGKTKVHLI